MGPLVQQCLGRRCDGVHIETRWWGGSSDQRSHQCCLSLGQGGAGWRCRSGPGAHATTALARMVIGGRAAAAAMASSSSSSSAAGG